MSQPGRIVNSHFSTHIAAWDRDYALRGRVWGGAVKDMPHLPDGEGLRVLELGCGDGKTLSAMRAGWQKVALDVSPQALILARKQVPDAFCILADACRMPIRSESFHAVFAFHVTGHLLAAERAALAGEAARVLLPGGRLFFRDFAEGDLRSGQGETVECGTFLRKNGIVTHFFREDEVAELFIGLKPESISVHRWWLRVKGSRQQRAEVQAVFIKMV